MENPENVLMELNGFEKAPLPVIPKSLEDWLRGQWVSLGRA